MNEKLSLDLDQLTVDSFDTADGGAEGGTARNEFTTWPCVTKYPPTDCC